MNNLFSVKDQVVVIIGGIGVLGKVIVVYLVEEGVKVVILGCKVEVGNVIVNEIKVKGGEVMFFVMNVLDEVILEQNLKDIFVVYGCVDVLLNVVGGNMLGVMIVFIGNFFDLKVDEFQKVFNLNFIGIVLFIQVFLKLMVEQKKGVIVNFFFMVVFCLMICVCGYVVVKVGIFNFIVFMVNEVVMKFGEGICVNVIVLGFFLIEQNCILLINEDGIYIQCGNDVICQILFKCFGKVEELCGIIQYFISDVSSFVIGIVVVVDGGFNVFVM